MNRSALGMAALSDTAKRELVQQLNADRDAYLSTFNRVHDTLIQSLAGNQSDSTTTIGPVPRPASASIQSSILPPLPAAVANLRRPTGSLSLHQDVESLPPRSIFSSGTGDDDEESGDEGSFFVQQPLPRESSTEEALRLYLQQHDWDEHGKKILGPLFTKGWFLNRPHLFWNEKTSDKDAVLNEASQVYDVGEDGSALLFRPSTKNVTQAIWHRMSNINQDPTKRQAVGQIAIMREPSPILFGAVHHAMNSHFDMDEIFRVLSDDSPTRAYMRGCFNEDPRHQRSFVFALKYYTIVEHERKPADWQSADLELRSSETHIPISDCSAVVALSLSGKPVETVRSKSRRAAQKVGQIYDPFAPWRVLSIQCFPDWKHTVDAHESNRHYVNGPEAFLLTLLVEYRDAKKRFLEINKRIMALATPPADFMFKEAVRDLLLFEDEKYTYSRRYFWAFQTLATMNDKIQDMIVAYRDTFTDDVWTGKNKLLWPGAEDQSSRFKNFRRKMANLRRDFENEIRQLEQVQDQNAREQKDIKSLREQLFSGTSVLETRKSLEQGQNIKLLTLVSIFFLPLTFVTSVFGMTNMPQNDNFNRFAIVAVTVCLPTYLMIGSLNHPRGMRWWQNRTADLYNKFLQLCLFLWKYIIRDTERAEDFRVRVAQRREERAAVSNQEDRSRGIVRSATTLEAMAARGNIYNTNNEKISQTPTPPLQEPRPSLIQARHQRTSSIKFDDSPAKRTPPTAADPEKFAMGGTPASSDPGPLGGKIVANGTTSPPPLTATAPAPSQNSMTATPPSIASSTDRNKKKKNFISRVFSNRDKKSDGGKRGSPV